MPVLVEFDAARRLFDSRVAVDSLSLEVQQGEVLGLVGRNGAGKTTSMRMLLGLIGPTSGSVRVFGCDPRHRGVQDGRRIAALLEVAGLYRDLTLRENLHYWARLYGLANVATAVDEALGFAELVDRQHDRAGTLSKGMAQKLALARAAMVAPEIIVLDELTSGVDPVFQLEVRERVLRLNERAATIVLSSHNLVEVEEICSRIVILDGGKVRACGTLDAVRGLVAGRTFDLRMTADQVHRVNDLLSALGRLGHCRRGRERHTLRLVTENGHHRTMIAQKLREVGFTGFSVASSEPTLSDVFDSLVGREPNS